jgi:GNAT superfamily N-acetyltransferase
LDRNDQLLAFIRAMREGYAVLGTLSGGSVYRQDGLLMVAGPHPNSIIANTALRTDLGVAPDDVLRRTRDYYDTLGWQFDLGTFAVEDSDIDDAAAAAGWHVNVELPCMIVDGPITNADPPEGVSIRRAVPAGDLRVVGRIVAECFADEDAQVDGMRAIFATSALIGDGGWPFVIASVGGDDVAAAGWFKRGEVGILGFVATLPAYRRRGIGAFVSRLATNAAFEAGARFVGLQASAHGRAVYAALGYETVGESTIWAPPAS